MSTTNEITSNRRMEIFLFMLSYKTRQDPRKNFTFRKNSYFIIKYFKNEIELDIGNYRFRVQES